MKNFMLAMVVSIAILILAQNTNRQRPRMDKKLEDEGSNEQSMKYIRYFSRCFMMILTINLLVDAYHLSQTSGYGCVAHDA